MEVLSTSSDGVPMIPLRGGLFASLLMSQRGEAASPRTHSRAAQSPVPAQPRGPRGTPGSLLPPLGCHTQQFLKPQVPMLEAGWSHPLRPQPKPLGKELSLAPSGRRRNNRKTVLDGVYEEQVSLGLQVSVGFHHSDGSGLPAGRVSLPQQASILGSKYFCS